MKHLLLLGMLLLAAGINALGETESIDLKALAKKARPAVMLLVASDAAGKEIVTGTGFLISNDGKLIDARVPSLCRRSSKEGYADCSRTRKANRCAISRCGIRPFHTRCCV